MAKQAPTEDYLRSLKESVKRDYEHQDRQIMDSRLVRELGKKSSLSDDLRLVDADVKDPALTDHGFRVSATMGLNEPTITVTPIRPTDVGQTNATNRERFSSGLMHKIGKQPTGMHAYAAMTDAAVNDGVAISKLVFSKDCWDYRYSLKLGKFENDPGYDPENPAYNKSNGLLGSAEKFNNATEDAKKQAGPPFKWRVVDALSWYPVFQGDEIGECIEITERPISSTFRQFRLGASANGDILLPEELGQAVPERDYNRILGSSVEFIEHWDDEWVSYYVAGKNLGNGKMIKQWRHGYGRHPYFPAYGLLMNHWRNRKVGWSVNQTMQALVELRSFLWTLMANVAARDTFPLLQEVPVDPSFAIQGTSGRPAGQVERWNMREIMRNRNGAKLEVIDMPQVAEALKIHMQQVDEAIKRLETPRITGDIGGLEGAGFAISQVLNEMMIRHQPIAQNIEESVTDMVRFVWDMIKRKVKETVYVEATGSASGWLGMGPEDFAQPVVLNVKVEPQQPSGMMVKQRIAHEALSAGTMSLDQAVEYLDRNPDEVRRGRRLDQIRQSPLYQQLADQALLAELGRGDLESLVLQAQQVVNGGQQGNPPAPDNHPAQDQPTGSGVPGDMAQQAMSNPRASVQVGEGTPGAVPGQANAGQPIAANNNASAGAIS